MATFPEVVTDSTQYLVNCQWLPHWTRKWKPKIYIETLKH